MARLLPGAFTRLDDADKDIILASIVAAGPPEGVEIEEVERQVEIIASWMFQTIVSQVLLEKLRSGEVRVTAKPGATEPDFALVKR